MGIKKYQPHREDDNRSLAINPQKVLLFLLLGGLLMLFLAFTGAYLYNRLTNPNIPSVIVPNIFIGSTLILVISSLVIEKAKHYYKQDNTRGYKLALLTTLVLTLFFMVMQSIGFNQLLAINVPSGISDNAYSYLKVISGLHFMHVFGGLPFLLLFYITAQRKMKDPVTVLIYFSDEEKKNKLNLLTIYWHFLDALWIYLILFFWINSFF